MLKCNYILKEGWGFKVKNYVITIVNASLLQSTYLCPFSFRFQEKGNLEVLLFTIQSRMRANNQRVYTPKEGVLVADINRVRRMISLIFRLYDCLMLININDISSV